MRDDDIDLAPDQLCCDLGRAVASPLGEMVLDGDVLPLDIAGLAQRLAEGLRHMFRLGRGEPPQDTDPGDPTGLRMSGQRPRHRRTTEKGYELAPPHSIALPALPRQHRRLRLSARASLRHDSLLPPSPGLPCAAYRIFAPRCPDRVCALPHDQPARMTYRPGAR